MLNDYLLLVANLEKLLYTVGISACGLLNREKGKTCSTSLTFERKKELILSNLKECAAAGTYGGNKTKNRTKHKARITKRTIRTDSWRGTTQRIHMPRRSTQVSVRFVAVQDSSGLSTTWYDTYRCTFGGSALLSCTIAASLVSSAYISYPGDA